VAVERKVAVRKVAVRRVASVAGRMQAESMAEWEAAVHRRVAVVRRPLVAIRSPVSVGLDIVAA